MESIPKRKISRFLNIRVTLFRLYTRNQYMILKVDKFKNQVLFLLSDYKLHVGVTN